MFKMENMKSVSQILITLIFILNVIPLYNFGVKAKKGTYFTCKGNKVEKILNNIPKFTRGEVANTKQKGNAKYNNVQDISIILQKGIRKTIKTLNINVKENAPIYNEQSTNYLDADLATQGVTFEAILPENFLSLRKLYDTVNDFNESFTSSSLIAIQNYKNKKYTKIFFTSDNKYVVKTIKKKQYDSLISILFDSFSHFCNFPSSLLPKYSGLYNIKHMSIDYYFVIIKNIYTLNTKENILLQFFLNGSDRIALKTNDMQVIDFELLDNNFIQQSPEGILIPSQEKKSILNVLEKDTKFLAKLNLISYNLLLVVCEYSNNAVEVEESSKTISNSNKHYKPIELNEEGRKLLVYYGIIDMLYSYDLKKKIQNAIKCISNDTVKDPTKYQKRFMQFITSKVFKLD